MRYAVVLDINNLPGLLSAVHQGLLPMSLVLLSPVQILGPCPKSHVLLKESLMFSFEVGDDLLGANE
jgi:hypothetical protein